MRCGVVEAVVDGWAGDGLGGSVRRGVGRGVRLRVVRRTLQHSITVTVTGEYLITKFPCFV